MCSFPFPKSHYASHTGRSNPLIVKWGREQEGRADRKRKTHEIFDSASDLGKGDKILTLLGRGTSDIQPVNPTISLWCNIQLEPLSFWSLSFSENPYFKPKHIFKTVPQVCVQGQFLFPWTNYWLNNWLSKIFQKALSRVDVGGGFCVAGHRPWSFVLLKHANVFTLFF